MATVTFWLKIRPLGAPRRYRRAPPPHGTRRRRLYAGYVVPAAQRTRKICAVLHFRFRRTAAICRILPGCCRMSSISSVVLRCRGVCAAGMRAASGCCVCLCSAGIHRRAVGLLMFNSLAQAETEPPGCCLYHSCTRACCVGAPARLMRGSPSVNLVIVSPPIVILPRRSPVVQ